MPAGFSLDGYTDLIRWLRERGYTVCGYEDAESSRPHLILRHDIDMNTALALTMAKTESELGVASTYFVLIRSNLYNPFSERSRADLRHIRALGHEIGLHFDASLYDGGREKLEAACREECDLLEACVAGPVKMVSFHRPAKHLLGIPGLIAGRRHAYEPHFFRDMGYCSDSRGGWHHGSPHDHEAVAEGRALQLLTHPIWWVGVPGESVDQRLDRLAFETLDQFRLDLATQCDSYRKVR